jgi:lysophospholipase L1-like esterase
VLHAHWLTEKGAVISSIGTRGPEPLQPKPEGVIRVLCLGDSGTFGWGVGDEETYPAQLESFLNAWAEKPAGFRFEVINAGVNGYSTFQSVQHYRVLEPLLNPDIVTLSTGRNDFVCLPLSDPSRPVLKPWQKTLTSLVSKCRTGQLLLKMRQYAFLTDRSKWVNRVNQQEFIGLMNFLLDDCARKNRPAAFVFRGADKNILRDLEKNRGLINIDLKCLDQLGEIEDFLTGGHPDGDTYHWIAKSIFHTFSSTGVLERVIQARSRSDG